MFDQFIQKYSQYRKTISLQSIALYKEKSSTIIVVPNPFKESIHHYIIYTKS